MNPPQSPQSPQLGRGVLSGLAAGLLTGLGTASNGGSVTSSTLVGLFFGSIYFWIVASGLWRRARELQRFLRRSGWSRSQRSAMRWAVRRGVIPEDDALRLGARACAQSFADVGALRRTHVALITTWLLVFVAFAIYHVVNWNERRLVGNLVLAGIVVLSAIGELRERRGRQRALAFLSQLPPATGSSSSPTSA